MRDHIRDALLIATVGTALIATGSAVFGLGRRLPPPPEVRPTPAPHVVVAPSGPPELARPE
jgi:hypothetical protein